MKKKLFYLSLLAMSIVSILFSSLIGVLGLEFSSAPNTMTTSSSEWKLVIDGAVHHPINLTFEELVAMPNSTVYAELRCFGQFITSGYWTGVRLELVLARAGLDQQAASVNLYAQDGYTTPLTITEVMREDVIIAYKKDNESLPDITLGNPMGEWSPLDKHDNSNNCKHVSILNFRIHIPISNITNS